MIYQGSSNNSPKIPNQISNISPYLVLGSPGISDPDNSLVSAPYKLFNGVSPLGLTSDCYISQSIFEDDNTVIIVFPTEVMLNRFVLNRINPQAGYTPKGITFYVSATAPASMADQASHTWREIYSAGTAEFAVAGGLPIEFNEETPSRALKVVIEPNSLASAVAGIDIYPDLRFDPSVVEDPSVIVALPYANVDLSNYYKKSDIDALLGNSKRPRIQSLYFPNSLRKLTTTMSWTVPLTGRLYYVKTTVDVPGAGTLPTSVRLMKNGINIGPLVSIDPTKTESDLALFDVAIDAGDRISVDITSISETTAKSLSVLIYHGDLSIELITVG